MRWLTLAHHEGRAVLTLLGRRPATYLRHRRREVTEQWLRRFADESNKIEGMGPATDKEVAALGAFVALQVVTVADLEHYVSTVAPGHRLRRKRGLNVRVGEHIAPKGGPEIEDSLVNLLNPPAPTTAYHQHVAYELLHPFTDGNGRSGRALWLWHHVNYGFEQRAKQLGFLHSFYYETLTHSRSPTFSTQGHN